MNEKNKRIIVISSVVLVILILVVIVFCNIGFETLDENGVPKEIIPEEEISDEQFRETTISLYFVNENNQIVEEMVKIDSKELLSEPYKTAMELLLNGPKDKTLKSAIPEETKINKIEKVGDCLNIDFSKEFIDNQLEDVREESHALNQIINTCTQFSEINKVKFSVEGKSDVSFKAGNIDFNQVFTREF